MDFNLFFYVLHWFFYCKCPVRQLVAEPPDWDTMLRIEQYSSYASHIHVKLRATQQFVTLPYVFPAVKQMNESNTYCSLDMFSSRPEPSCLAAFFVYLSFCQRRMTVRAPSVAIIAKHIFGRTLNVFNILRLVLLK